MFFKLKSYYVKIKRERERKRAREIKKCYINKFKLIPFQVLYLRVCGHFIVQYKYVILFNISNLLRDTF